MWQEGEWRRAREGLLCPKTWICAIWSLKLFPYSSKILASSNDGVDVS